jgi:hypothetical protein
MRNFLITAAALTAFATLASAPAGAAENYGPSKVGNQCWSPSLGLGREGSFGTWGNCPQTASIATAPKHKKK